MSAQSRVDSAVQTLSLPLYQPILALDFPPSARLMVFGFGELPAAANGNSEPHAVPAMDDGGSHPGLLPTSSLWR